MGVGVGVGGEECAELIYCVGLRTCKTRWGAYVDGQLLMFTVYVCMLLGIYAYDPAFAYCGISGLSRPVVKKLVVVLNVSLMIT